MAEVVVDASALVDLLLGNELSTGVRDRLAGHELHAPAHLPAEVLSALGRLHRAGDLDADEVESRLRWLSSAPIQHHDVINLLAGCWARRHGLRMSDALYVELAASTGLPLVTTDRRLRDAPMVEVIAV